MNKNSVLDTEGLWQIVSNSVMRFKFLLLAALYEQTSIAAIPTATIDSGVIVGTTTAVPDATAVVNQFLGIPFASSPPRRFEPPQNVVPFAGFLKTQAWKPSCVQQFNCNY